MHQVLIVLERQIGNKFKFAGAFNVDSVEAVYQNI
jgi:hypothetical protein